MSTFTVPRLFPQLFDSEAYNRKILKSSLIRKIAAAQNYIWSKFVRIYANGGYEGHGYRLFHQNSAFNPNTPGNATLAGADLIGDNSGFAEADQEPLPDGNKGLCICSFMVPPNWAPSRRVKVQGEYTFRGGDWVGGELVNEADIWVVLCNRDGSIFSYNRWSDTYGGTIQTAATDTFAIEIEVPQDQAYFIRVFIQHLDHSTNLNNANYAATDFAHGIEVPWISARYDTATDAELNGHPLGQTWIALADFFRDGMPVASAFLLLLMHNTRYLAGARPPELCQAWLAEPYGTNGFGYTRVGKYLFWSPSQVTKMKGQIFLKDDSGGSTSSLRIDVNGVTVQTTALAGGEQTIDVAEFTVNGGNENYIEIYARAKSGFSTALSGLFGVNVKGVSFWESGTTLNLPANAYEGTPTTVPVAYQPIDEEAIEGDDPVTAERLNSFAQRAGLRTLFDNDRWLAANRLRHVIGDWRHHAMKHGGLYVDDTVDQRMDWTPAARDYPFTGFHARPKNITVRGEGAPVDVDDYDGQGKSPDGIYSTIDGYNAAPYTYPTDLTYPIVGRRLGRFYGVRPVGVDTHIGNFSNLRMCFRARRLRPLTMAADVNGLGPGAEETEYIGKGYLQVKYNTTKYIVPILAPSAASASDAETASLPGDVMPKWLSDLVIPHEDADPEIRIYGRLPRQPFAGGGNTGRPEGMLFEVELLSWYIADEPLAAELLRTL